MGKQRQREPVSQLLTHRLDDVDPLGRDAVRDQYCIGAVVILVAHGRVSQQQFFRERSHEGHAPGRQGQTTGMS